MHLGALGHRGGARSPDGLRALLLPGSHEGLGLVGDGRVLVLPELGDVLGDVLEDVAGRRGALCEVLEDDGDLVVAGGAEEFGEFDDGLRGIGLSRVDGDGLVDGGLGALVNILRDNFFIESYEII